MPKKHAPNYIHTKPSYVHPSLQSSRSSISSTPLAPQTVTERIQQLRREQAPRATSERRDEVTEVLGSRTRNPAYQTRRSPPGPATPSSWLVDSRHALPFRRLRELNAEDGEWQPASRPKPKNKLMAKGNFCSLAILDNGNKRLPHEPSLLHSCLKTFAQNWEELVEYEQHYLAALPIPVKEALLSYVSRHGPTGCMDIKSFKTLFRTDQEVQNGTGSDEVQFLDLTELLNQDFTIMDFFKSMTHSTPQVAVTEPMSQLSISYSKGKEKVEEVAESWEDEIDPVDTSLPSTISIPRFPNLTRLSLAHPGSWASWPHLLTLSTKLNTLTHLSLAYWPTPSSTPNATTASMISKHTRISLGGSNLYSEMDDDWHEAANILRRLSLNTYCLQWLDLEGCIWHKALTWDFPNSSEEFRRQTVDGGEDEWVRLNAQPGPDWAGSWRQIEYLNLSQGWIPRNQRAIMSMPAGTLPVQLLGWIRNQKIKGEEISGRNESGADVEVWMERERVARCVEEEIVSARKKGNGKWCRVDHGWDPDVVVRVKKTGSEDEG
ncbi:hypothetical protein K469DRAFT_751104 [Zopfia rhizophila CBS 207.26]|uniref:Tafazzin n=1 Tax=Zopfia rhizophila CBS 207.26 TaxID=1314779 RepID=A0A6A6E0G4_9PEZI|nr:hypothetical protein K469DRAFT_751104 [Zopfia rhizophila CBS 207.26]